MKKIVLLGLALTLVFAGCSLKNQAVKISPEEAMAKGQSFINENLMPEGSEVTVLEAVEDSGLYKLKVKLPATQGEQEVDSYMTLDGKTFFTQGLKIDEIEQEKQDAQNGTQAEAPKASAPTNLDKSDKPVVELFVMSHCPYGTQIEKGILPAVEALGDKIDFELKFCDYAMHGQKELDEELNQYCVQQQGSNKFNVYLKCFLEDGNTSNCLREANIDQTQLNTCIKNTDEQYKVSSNYGDKSTWKGSYPTFNIFKADTDKYGVKGSPTLVINGKQISSGRDSASLLNTICAAFNEKPQECNASLSSDTPSPGFGYGTASGGSAAECGS